MSVLHIPVTATAMPEWVRRCANSVNSLIATQRTLETRNNEIYAGTAGAVISGHRAVYVSTTDGKVYPSIPDATSRFCIGVTIGAAASGASVSVRVSGIITEPSWTWTMAQPVWLGASGALTQTQPTTGALFQVGVPLGATALRIEPQLLALLS